MIITIPATTAVVIMSLRAYSITLVMITEREGAGSGGPNGI